MEKLNENRLFWKRLLFSQTLVDKDRNRKIAYVAMMTALNVVANMFFEFKFAETQFSFTIVVSAITGIIIGPLFGFVACFLGDLVGFLYHSAGLGYLPWVGVAMGMVALISGFVVNGLPLKIKGAIYFKLAIVSILTFAICTVGINTTAFWLLYSKVPYGTYLISRLFLQGQIWNSVVNYALLFVLVPIVARIPFLRIKIR